MPYPRFTKVIISHFISKDKKISMKNKINLHTIRDDSLPGTLKFVSKTQDYQQYGAMIPDDMINQNIKDYVAYKTYYEFATGKVPPRKARKYKKSTTAPTTGVIIRDTLGVSVSKKKAPTKADRSKCIEILSDVALSEASQLKEATKRSKKDFHISQASGSGDGTDLESGVPDDEDDNDNDNANDDDSENEDDDGSDAHDSKRTGSGDDDESPSFTLKDYDEEEHDEEYEFDDDYENLFEEEDDDLYKDVDMTDDSKQSSSVSSDFANQFLILEKAPPSDHEVASLMNITATVIPDSSAIASTTTPPTTSMISPLPQLMTLTIASTTTLISTILDFSSLFGFDQRVFTLETRLSQLKQADQSAQLLESVKSQLPTMVDDRLSTRIRYAIRTTLESYFKEFEKKAQEERKLYIDVVEKSVKDIIKDEVKSQLPQILSKEVSDFTTPEIQSTINESP
ncbi:hypothetical protein Tco_0445570 [Tanacetum coccineum]